MRKRKKHLIRLLLIFFFGITSEISVAQAVDFTGNAKEVKDEYAFRPFDKINVTSRFISDTYYKDVGYKYSILKAKLAHLKNRKPDSEAGKQREFYVRDVISGNEWYSELFILSYTNSNINIWIQKSAYDTLAGSDDLTSMLEGFDTLLHESTPAYSIDPSKGILGILQEYVGEFPNVDGDGVLDVLVLDIADTFRETGSFVAGFFDPVNLYEFEFSNYRDIIYLDLYPTILYESVINMERAVSTFAHESQHLIHAGYEGEEPELVFVNEGFSEAVEILCGFEPRPVQGFQQSPLRKLTYWDHQNPIPDYSRASLWMHYLMEQLGPVHLKDFVQNPEIGINGYKKVLEEHSLFTFKQIFQNWGLAMLLNNARENPAYGYKHALRQGIILNKRLSYNKLPGIFNKPLPRYVNVPVHFSLAEELDFSIGKPTASNVWLSSISRYPGNSKQEIYTLNQSTIFANARNTNYGSIDILISNFGSDISDSASFSFIGDGNASGTEVKTSFGDVKPDKFYRNASYLSLEGVHEKLAVIFPPAESSYWLKDIKLWTLFKSELEGTGVDGDVERDFIVHVYSILDGKPDQRLLSPLRINIKRDAGKLVEETFSLSEYYDQLSAIEDSVMIIIGNDADVENYIALGLDKGTKNATLFSQEMDIGIGWEKLSDKNIGGNSLFNWNPAIEVTGVIPEVEKRYTASIGDIDYTMNRVSVTIKPSFRYDSSSITMAAKMPDGSFEHGQIFEGDEVLKDEGKMIKAVDVLRNDYVQRHVNYYERLVDKYYAVHTACRFLNPFKPSNCSGAYSDLNFARYRRSAWKDVRGEIDNLGKTWSTLINSYRIETVTIRSYIPPCENGGGRLPGQFNDQLIDKGCSQNPGGEYRYQTYTLQIADKNDGVVNIHSALWSANDSFGDRNNRYFSDVPADGGYNHFELRNYARDYDLEGQFEVGDESPPMQFAKNWMLNGYRF